MVEFWFPIMQSVSSYSPPERYRVRVFKGGGEYGPAVSVYWNDRLAEYVDLYYYIVLIQNEKRSILVNTGMPDDFSDFEKFVKAWHPACRLYREEAERLTSILESAGLTPEDIDLVLITPLTVYTTGNLRLFPKATICLNRRGWIDFWAPDRHAPRLPMDIAMCRESRLFLADGGISRIRLLEDEEWICPGISCFRTGGHHASSMAIAVNTEKGTVILGDCFFTYDNLEKNIPIGWAENHHEIYAAYARVREEADIAVPLYDPEVLRRFPGGVIA
jgi:glyoxylase-like metal-dependent hydrolase (beta-lactamase superfamily II)